MQNAAFLDIESDSDIVVSQSKLVENPLDDNPDQASRSAPFWSVNFFQNLFDIDTDQVLNRLYGAVVPFPKSFLKHRVNGKPDLYGPFWICTTLVFSIAISGNLANYLQAGAANPNQDYHWKYDFHAVTLSASAIYSYAWIVPLGLWGALKWMVPEEVIHFNMLHAYVNYVCFCFFSCLVKIPIVILIFVCFPASPLFPGAVVCLRLFFNHIHSSVHIMGDTSVMVTMAARPCWSKLFSCCFSWVNLASCFSDSGSSIPCSRNCFGTSCPFGCWIHALLLPCFSLSS